LYLNLGKYHINSQLSVFDTLQIGDLALFNRMKFRNICGQIFFDSSVESQLLTNYEIKRFTSLALEKMRAWWEKFNINRYTELARNIPPNSQMVYLNFPEMQRVKDIFPGSDTTVVVLKKVHKITTDMQHLERRIINVNGYINNISVEKEDDITFYKFKILDVNKKDSITAIMPSFPSFPFNASYVGANTLQMKLLSLHPHNRVRKLFFGSIPEEIKDELMNSEKIKEKEATEAEHLKIFLEVVKDVIFSVVLDVYVREDDKIDIILLSLYIPNKN